MTRAAVALALATAIAPLGAAGFARGPRVEQRSVNQQRVYVSVVDKHGAPAASLSPGDLTIKEDGVAREILKVEPATDAMAIALLMDTGNTSSRAIPHRRDALKAFTAAIWARSPDTQIALYSFGERPILVLDFSSQAGNLDRRIDRLLGTSGSGSYFIDAVVEAAVALGKRAPVRPVIVAYADENGPEYSHRRHEHAAEALTVARASLWTIWTMNYQDPFTPLSAEHRERALVIGDVTTQSGGRSAMVVDGTGLTTRFLDVAHQLLAQFVVTYGRPETLVPPDKLEIRLTNNDLRLAAPRWTTR